MSPRRAGLLEKRCQWQDSGSENTPPFSRSGSPPSHPILIPGSRPIDSDIRTSAADCPRIFLDCIQAVVPRPKPSPVIATEPSHHSTRLPHFLLFLHLPDEIIEEIYVYSSNIFLAQTNSYLYNLLNQTVVRFRLCAHVFSQRLKHKDPYFGFGPVAGDAYEFGLVEAQTSLIAKPWFTSTFARQLETTTPVLQTLADERREADDEIRQQHHDLPADGSDRLMWCVVARMPKDLLLGKWTDETAELFLRLRSWWVEPDLRNMDYSRFKRSLKLAEENGKQEVAAELGWYCTLMRKGISLQHDSGMISWILGSARVRELHPRCLALYTQQLYAKSHCYSSSMPCEDNPFWLRSHSS